MGFWDVVKDITGVVKDITGKVAEIGKEYTEIHTRLKGYSDDKLLDICNDTGFLGSSTSTERKMAKAILEKRGHKF